ncbi:MAG: DUF309 domain-containing protein [Chloroflexi bacterium]|nr:DUF309 domain-containing protein [Chloroflexota bacterium]
MAVRGAPPQHGAPGERPALDRRWLAHLRRDGAAAGDGATLAYSGTLERGIAEFNDGRFFASHETWEALWRDTRYPERLFCLALTKLGAGFEHGRRANPHGAAKLLSDALAFLAPFMPAFAGLDVRALHEDVSAWLRAERSSATPTIRRAPSPSPSPPAGQRG